MSTGMIYNIQRLSTKDGPGIRTVVFFKGCPLRCRWCCNPESQRQEAELLVFNAQCVQCGRCMNACPRHAVSMPLGETPRLDRSLCMACGTCADICPVNARELCGREMELDDVMRVVKKDLVYYRNTGGGVTCSGGEATVQSAFLLELLERCFYSGIHTALETCGFCAWETLEKALPFLNLILYDVKHLDPGVHLELTGAGNARILENLKKLAARSAPVILRMPFIPGKNNSREHIEQLGVFAAEHDLRDIHLIPLHGLGLAKYSALDRPQPNDTRNEQGLTPREAADLLNLSSLHVSIL